MGREAPAEEYRSPEGSPAGIPDAATDNDRYHEGMKKLLLVVAAVAAGAIVYKILTTEIPLEDES